MQQREKGDIKTTIGKTTEAIEDLTFTNQK